MAKKKALMTTLWRISQTGPFLSVFFWSTALAGIFWPIVGQTPGGPEGPLWYFIVDVLGVPTARAALVGLTILVLVGLGAIFTFGYIYDRVLRLWQEQVEIAYDRNPYMRERLYPKEVVLVRMHIAILSEVGKGNAAAMERVRAMEAWVESQLRLDPVLAKGVKELESYSSRSPP
jgi:hypothetical protein